MSDATSPFRSTSALRDASVTEECLDALPAQLGILVPNLVTGVSQDDALTVRKQPRTEKAFGPKTGMQLG